MLFICHIRFIIMDHELFIRFMTERCFTCTSQYLYSWHICVTWALPLTSHKSVLLAVTPVLQIPAHLWQWVLTLVLSSFHAAFCNFMVWNQLTCKLLFTTNHNTPVECQWNPPQNLTFFPCLSLILLCTNLKICKVSCKKLSFNKLCCGVLSFAKDRNASSRK